MGRFRKLVNWATRSKQGRVRKRYEAPKKATYKEMDTRLDARARAKAAAETVFFERGADNLAFTEACGKLNIGEPVQKFGELYNYFSRFPLLARLEQLVESEIIMGKTEGVVGEKEFNKADFWAKIMVVNGLQAVKQARVPKEYAMKLKKLKTNN